MPFFGKDGALPVHNVMANFVLQSETEGRPTTKAQPPTPTQDPDKAMSHGFIMILQGGFDGIAMDSMLDVLEAWMFRHKVAGAINN